MARNSKKNKSTNKPPTSNEAKETNQVTNDEGRKGWKDKITEEIKTGQFWINVFLLFFTGFTYYTAKQSNEIAKQQFADENQSYIKIEENQIFNFDTSTEVEYGYIIKCVGSQPIKIDSSRLGIIYAPVNMNFDSIYNYKKEHIKELHWKAKPLYIDQNSPSAFTSDNFDRHPTAIDLYNVFSGQYRLCIAIDITYFNLVTKNKYLYEGIVQFVPEKDFKFPWIKHKTVHESNFLLSYK